MSKQIYFYSDPARYEDQVALGKTPMLKIGDTTQQTTDERIKQQDTTACAQLLEKKGSYFTSFGDKEFHKHLESLGYKKTRAEREWFYITVEDAERELIDYRDGVVKVQKYFSPRPHQAWVNQQILVKYDRSRTVIQPLNLCARFGKTLQALSLFKDSGLQVMIVAAHWLAANNSFVSTVNERFDIAADIKVIKPDYQEFKAAVDKGQRVLIDVSLHTDAEQIDPLLITALQEYQSLIYIDEADFGAWTESSRQTANQFINTNNNLVCVATGTNIDRALIGTRGHIEAPITVAYLDLIEAKRGEGYLFQPDGFCSDNPQQWQDMLSDIVEVDVLSLDAGSDLVDELNDLTDEKRPNMAKVFAKRNSHIQTKIIKSLLFDEDYGAESIRLEEITLPTLCFNQVKICDRDRWFNVSASSNQCAVNVGASSNTNQVVVSVDELVSSLPARFSPCPEVCLVNVDQRLILLESSNKLGINLLCFSMQRDINQHTLTFINRCFEFLIVRFDNLDVCCNVKSFVDSRHKRTICCQPVCSNDHNLQTRILEQGQSLQSLTKPGTQIQGLNNSATAIIPSKDLLIYPCLMWTRREILLNLDNTIFVIN